jgi:hypothetical protein
MDNQDLELQLLEGSPIEIENVGLFYVPTLREITKIKYSKYMNYVSIVLFDKKNIENFQDSDFENFELAWTLCYQDVAFRERLFEALSFFLRDEISLVHDDQGLYLYLTKNETRIDEGSFATIQLIVKKMNFIKEPEAEFKPANSKAQEMIELLKKIKKNKPAPKEKINLKSIISGLAWKPNGMNIKNIFDITIYQLYDGFLSTENIDNHYHTFTGIYSGNVDAKKIDVSSFHWAKIIDN